MAEALPSRLMQHESGEAHFSNHIGKEKGKKVRFEDIERNSHHAKLSEKPRVPIEGGGIIMKDKTTGELLPFGEYHQVQQQPIVQESEEVRLKGKLRWLFEQDRMFWASNDTKAASESKNSGEVAKPSAEQQPKVNDSCSRSMSRNSNKHPHHGVTARSESLRSSSFKMSNVSGLHQDGKSQKERGSFRYDKASSRQSTLNHKPMEPTHCEAPGKPSAVFEASRDRECSSPIKSWEFKDAKGSFDEGSFGVERSADSLSSKVLPSKATSNVGRFRKSASMNLPRALNNNKGMLASEDFLSKEKGPAKTRLSPDRKTTFDTSNQKSTKQTIEPSKVYNPPEVTQQPFLEAEVSELDLGAGDAYYTDYEDAAPNSTNSNSEDEDDIMDERTKVGAAGYVEDMKDRTTFLKAKCNLLAKEKDIAVRKWKRSCLEIDQAAQMAQALRSAIETLLEVSIGSEPTVDFKSKRFSLEEHTRALKARMEKLRRKSAELHPHPEPEDLSLVGRIETLKKKTPEVRGLASPEVPLDTENKVEDLKARLEKLMLATNSRVVTQEVTDEREHVISTRLMEKKKRPPMETLHPEKAELKMRGWYNSLSAELSAELTANLIDSVQPNSSVDKCDVSSENGHTRETSYSGTPLTSKQVSPLHPLHQGEDTASTYSSEETKIKVIHKIAEEVRAESEQWYQVQELLQRVGEDMKRLQEACSTWERRALLAESQVETLLHEDQGRKERLHVGDQKIAELQTEMVRLRDTVDEVRKQLGSVDPSRWFEAANKFGYAFVPVMRPAVSGNYSFRHQSNADNDEFNDESSDDRARREIRQKSAMDCDVSSSDRYQPSCSGAGIREQQTTTMRTTMSGRRDHKLPSSQWANEIAKAEEDEIFQSKMLGTSDSHQMSRLDFVNNRSSTTEKVFSSPLESLQDIHSRHENPPQPSRPETKLDESMKDEPKDAILLPPIPKESSTTTEDLPRNANLSSLTSRLPLKVVLGNVVPSSKENKKPS